MGESDSDSVVEGDFHGYQLSTRYKLPATQSCLSAWLVDVLEELRYQG